MSAHRSPLEPDWELPAKSRGRSNADRRGRPTTWLLACLLVSSCQAPTTGPTVNAGEDGWIADPLTTMQERERFEVTLVNSLDTPVSFVIVRLDYGEATDLPVVNGVVDVNRTRGAVYGPVEYEVYDPNVSGPLVVAYHMVYPDVEEVTESTVPVLEPGEETKVTIGNAGLGGGEPGSYAVISHEPGGLERGDYAVFNLTDENGVIPRLSPVDFCVPDPFEPLNVGDRFLSWQGSLLDGGVFDSGTLAGHPTLIFVFPAHQPDDIEVLEVFKAVVDSREGEIEAVMVDTAAAGDEERVIGLLDEAGVTAPVVIEDGCELQAVFRIGWEQPPYWILTDGSGVITGLEYGPRSVDQIQSLIDHSVASNP